MTEHGRRGRESYTTQDPSAVLAQQTQLELSGDRCSDRSPNLLAALDLLERQACNCDLFRDELCLRCELLELLR